MKKRVLALILMIAAIFSCAAFPQTVWASAYSVVRVKLSVNAASINVTVDGVYTVSEDASLSVPRGSYTVSVSGTKVRLKGNGVDKVVGTSLTFVRGKYTGSGNNYFTIAGTDYGTLHYLGDMVFTVSGSKLLVINRVPVEEYLYGVVAYEMSNAFPLEALKAQAVCARGYVIRALSPSDSYDIGDTSADQVYKGYNSANTNVINAVNATKGQVLKYNNAIISTYYSASNGGQTELPGNAWGGGTAKNNSYPYLAQRDDPYDLENPSSLHQELFVPKQVAGSAYDPVSVPGDYAVRIVNCNESCNVRSGPGTSYSILGQAPVNSLYEWLATSGEWHKVTYKGSTAYISTDYALKVSNGRYLYSSPVLADLQKKAHQALVAGGKSITAATDVKLITVNSMANGTAEWPGTGSRCYVTANANVTVQYVAAGTSALSGSTSLNVVLTLMNKSGSSYVLSHDYLNSSLRMRGVKTVSGGYQVTNARYGHGVGMSQRGAQTMASAHGMNYSSILAFYFKNAVLASVDTTVPSLPDAEAPKLSSSKYKISSSSVTGLSAKLSVSQFLANFSVSGGSVKLVTSSGAAKSSGTVATGDVLQLKNSAGSVYKKYTLILYGDVNGDGGISLVDLLRVQKHLLGTATLGGAYSAAADVSKDSKVSILDLLRLQKYLLGTGTIAQ